MNCFTISFYQIILKLATKWCSLDRNEMKNENNKTQYNPLKAKDYFSQFSKENLLKIGVIADVIKGELEITKKRTNEEKERNRSELDDIIAEEYGEEPYTYHYDNSDYILRLNFNRIPLNVTPDEFVKLLHKVGGSFRFLDPTTPENPPLNEDYHVGITNKENFEFFYEQLERFTGVKSGLSNKNLEIYYQEAGIGTANGKEFKIRTEIKRNLFSELYKQINHPVIRSWVLILITYYDENEKPSLANKSTETYEINKIVKELRKDVGINKKQLINNNGNLTLIGTKMEPK